MWDSFDVYVGEKIMDNVKFYGDEPYKVIVLCGDLDASGQLVQYIEQLSPGIGTVEVLQKSTVKEDIVLEVAEIIEDYCSGLVTIVGQGRGAEIAYLCASQYPKLTNNVVVLESDELNSKDLEPIEGVELLVVENDHFVEKMHALMASE